ncbi:MAG: hypothetical protein U5N58_06455 [Actinomycetota bacterium]|nr:hypothetical protein [Actinomycetota bacterium]
MMEMMMGPNMYGSLWWLGFYLDNFHFYFSVFIIIGIILLIIWLVKRTSYSGYSQEKGRKSPGYTKRKICEGKNNQRSTRK